MTGGNWKELLRASGAGNLRLVTYHLDNDADPNYQHPEFFTAPIFEAIRGKQYDAVKILLDRGTNINLMEDSSDLFPIEVALAEKQHAIVDLLASQDGVDKSCLKKILVVGRNHRSLVSRFVDLGHDVFWLDCDVDQIETIVAETGNSKLCGTTIDDVEKVLDFSPEKLVVSAESEVLERLLADMKSGEFTLLIQKLSSCGEIPSLHENIRLNAIVIQRSTWEWLLGRSNETRVGQSIQELMFDDKAGELNQHLFDSHGRPIQPLIKA